MLRMQGPPDVNQSVPGLVLKLHRFGGPVLPFEALKVAGWVFSAVIVWATLPPTVIAAITTLQTGAILLLFWLAIRTGRAAATPAPGVSAASA